MKSILLFASIISFQFGLAQIKIEKDLKDLDSTFERVLKDWHGAGFSVAVVDHDRIVYAKGFGYRNVDKKLPVTANTLFAIGSCTKAFTASMIGNLQKEGKVDIDAPVRNYLPSLHFYNDAMNNSITLRMMMSHTTGLPRHDFSWYLFTSSSRDSMLQRIQYMQPTTAFREKWQYNNFMFFAQGVLIEKLTGKTWEQNIKEHFFDPLGMNRSTFLVSDLSTSDDASLGYDVKKDSIIKKVEYYNISSMGPAGSINSCVNDMAKWLIAWIHEGKFGKQEIIPSSFVSEAISSQSIIGASTPTKEHADLYFSNYGFAWMLSSYRGHYRVEHGGNIDGFSASTCFFPSDSLGIVVLTNQNNSSIPSIVRNIIADRMMGLPKYEWSNYLKNITDNAKATARAVEKSKIKTPSGMHPPTHPLNDYTGNYFQAGYGNIIVCNMYDSLIAIMGGKKIWLRPDNYDVFDPFEIDPADGIDTSEQLPVKIQFQSDISGKIAWASIPFEAGLPPLIFTRQAVASMDIKKVDLKKYIGDYDLTGQKVQVYIKNGNTLFVLVPGQPEYELVPEDKDKFALKIISGYYVQFNKGPDGKIQSLTFIQPNGNFNAKKS